MKKVIVALCLLGCNLANIAHAEDPSPYKGVHFSWTYGDYASHAGFNIYKAGTVEPIVKITDRTKRTHFHAMPLVTGQSVCFTMDAVDSKGIKTAPTKEACFIVPLPGVASFLAFPGVQ
jgi:hypothetical protein